VQRVLPMFVSECGEASARCRRPSDIVDQNVDAAEAIPHVADDLLRTPSRAEVGFHEQIRLKQVVGGGSSRGDHRCSRTSEALNYGFAYAFGAAGHEHALAGEFGFGGAAHLCISTGTI